MEILIVGVLLVAAMIFVSTKIKKSAADAFEREIIERENFKLVKPKGFISPLNENSEFAFEAYTKEFGKNDADEFRQAWVNLVVTSDLNFPAAIESIRKADGKILSEKLSPDAPDGQKICLIESEKIDKEVKVKKFYKIVESSKHREIYQLRISVLDAYKEIYSSEIREMLDSFVVK